MDLIADQWIRLADVGLENHQKLALSSVAIDLPIQSEQDPMFAAAHILSIGNRAHRPSYVTAEELLDPSHSRWPRPGQDNDWATNKPGASVRPYCIPALSCRKKSWIC